MTHDQEKGQVAVTIRGDGRLRYQDFFLGNPDRLVVDFTDVTGGGSFVTTDPSKIGEIFLQAIALRPPAPRTAA